MIRLKTKEIGAETAAAPTRAAPASVPAPVASAGESAWRVLPLEGSFEFSYRDAAGAPSLRRVAAVELKVGPGKLLLGGVDEQLDAYRGFRVDRIHSLRAMDTDDIVTRNILDWLMERAQRQERARAATARKAKPQAEARAG